MHDNTILEKPSDRDHAIQMIQKLSGSDHYVVSGVALLVPTQDRTDPVISSFSESTTVRFGNLEQDEIEGTREAQFYRSTSRLLTFCLSCALQLTWTQGNHMTKQEGMATKVRLNYCTGKFMDLVWHAKVDVQSQVAHQC